MVKAIEDKEQRASLSPREMEVLTLSRNDKVQSLTFRRLYLFCPAAVREVHGQSGSLVVR